MYMKMAGRTCENKGETGDDRKNSVKSKVRFLVKDRGGGEAACEVRGVLFVVKREEHVVLELYFSWNFEECEGEFSDDV